jgi:hypothetical protein
MSAATSGNFYTRAPSRAPFVMFWADISPIPRFGTPIALITNDRWANQQ